MLLLLSLSLLRLGGVVGAETDETMKVMEGDSVTLHTNLTDICNDDTILWLFGPKESVISQINRKNDLTSYFVTDDVLFRGRLQVDQKSGSLTIRNTRVRHSGQFKLSISREKTTKKTFHVTVFDVVGETDGVKSVSVKEGESVTLNTDVSEVQREDLIVWRFGDKGILLAKIDVETNKISLNDADERFRVRLKLDQQTGSLTITNTRTEHSGLYELQIIGRESSQRFLLSVTAVPDPGLSPRAIAGIVVAALLVAAVLFSVVIYYRRKISKLQMVNEVSVADGDSVTLKTGTVLQKDDKTKWWYLHHNDLIAEISGETNVPYDGLEKRFRSKLELDSKTGSLTINNTMPIHSGLYILEISSKTRRTIKKRFILTVEMMTVPVKEGKATLEIKNMKQTGDLILWTFGAENRLVVKADSATSTGERFRDRLELDHESGSLIIKDIKDTDYGHFKLQLINSDHTTFKRFNVTVTGPTGEHLNDSMTAENPLLDKV